LDLGIKESVRIGEDGNTCYRTVCRTVCDGEKGNGECDVLFIVGKPVAVIHVYGKIMETAPLDPQLLKPSPVPEYDLVYLGAIRLDSPEQN
jgi:hypothetical protein